MKTRSIDQFSDAELARMVRDSIYVQNTRFDQDHARFLIVFAVPYGREDTVESLPEALDGFARLLQDDDWKERTFQVYDHEASQHYYQAAPEECEQDESLCTCANRSWYGEEHDSACELTGKRD